MRGLCWKNGRPYDWHLWVNTRTGKLCRRCGHEIAKQKPVVVSASRWPLTQPRMGVLPRDLALTLVASDPLWRRART